MLAAAQLRPATAPVVESMKSAASQAESSPAGSAVQVRPPSSLVNTPDGKQCRGSSDGPAVRLVEELDSVDAARQQLGVVIPMLAAVARLQHGRLGRLRVGLSRAAGGPAGLLIEKMNRLQVDVDSGDLHFPGLAAVEGVPDDAAISHGPASATQMKQTALSRARLCRSESTVGATSAPGAAGR